MSFFFVMFNDLRVMVMVFNVTFNTILVISSQSDFTGGGTGSSGENHRPPLIKIQVLRNGEQFLLHIISIFY
jgi:hypothetical protein